MKRIIHICLMVITICGLVLYGCEKTKEDKVLISQEVESAPTELDSPQWNNAKEVEFVLEGAGSVEGKTIETKVKSVYTKEEIFFLLEWPDADKSMNKKKWRFTGGKWVKQKGDEDRLGIVWEISRIDKFATKGCAILCHNESENEKDWYYAVSSKKEKADLWHWKAVRANPVGYTEDGYVVTNPSKEPEKGRFRDAGSGKAKGNSTKDKSGPAYMQDLSKPASIKGSLLVDEAVKISGSSVFKDGDEIPGYMLNTKWTGSFADIKTKGVWKDGKWTVMLSRKLRTENDDDVQYNTKKKYSFGIATFDNAHEHHSYNSDPLKLQFK